MSMMSPIFASLALLAASDPAAPPPPAAVLAHGLAYFERDAERRIPRTGFDPIAYLAAKVPADAHVYVRGQTETLGEAAANHDRSLRWARSVADELVSMGIRPDRITLFACGETFLGVPTPDGVAEPLNNLAEFDWGRPGRQPPAGCTSHPYGAPVGGA